MCRSLVVLAAFLAVLFAPLQGRAEETAIPAAADPGISEQPLVRETCEFYDVHGETVEELRADLRRKGKRLSTGSSYDASTRWDIRWEYGYAQAPDACSVSGFRAFVDVNFRYPQWLNNNAPLTVAAVWGGYMENLVLHENGHRDLAVAAAAELVRAVSRLPPASTCADLDREVLALGRAAMKQLYCDETAYDAATEHGVSQGAVLR